MQTTSLELSKRLHELGFKGESELMWANLIGQHGDVILLIDTDKQFTREHFPAYQFHELWEALPVNICGGQLYQWKNNDSTCIGYLTRDPLAAGMTFALNVTMPIYQAHKSPTEAAGLLLAWAIENGHVEVKGG